MKKAPQWSSHLPRSSQLLLGSCKSRVQDHPFERSSERNYTRAARTHVRAALDLELRRDCGLCGTGIDRNLARLHLLGDRNCYIENAFMELAMHLLQIESLWKRDRRVELAIRQL